MRVLIGVTSEEWNAGKETSAWRTSAFWPHHWRFPLRSCFKTGIG